MAKKGRKRKTVQAIDTSGHTRLTRDLENLRKKYVRRIEKFTNTAKEFSKLGNDYLADKYMEAANSLEIERKNLTVKNITSIKPTMKGYKEAVERAIKSAKERLAEIPVTKPKELVSRETLGKVRYKYANQLFQYTYAKGIWGEDDDRTSRTEKLKSYYRKQKGLPSGAKVSEADLLDFFENEISDYLGNEFTFNTSAMTGIEEPASLYQIIANRVGWKLNNNFRIEK